MLEQSIGSTSFRSVALLLALDPIAVHPFLPSFLPLSLARGGGYRDNLLEWYDSREEGNTRASARRKGAKNSRRQ